MATTISGNVGLSRFAEKQMRNWEIARRQRLEPRRSSHATDFITLSNVVGAGGVEVAAELGRSLGWPVYDRELLMRMAGDDETRAVLYHSMDERDLGWIEAMMRTLVNNDLRKQDYFHKLVETVQSLARQGPSIFVGRAIDLVLPNNRGLRVKLTASLDYCAKHLTKYNQHLSLDDARAQVSRIEAERTAFVHHHFPRISHEDSTRFDLTLNVERFSTRQIVQIILAARKMRIEASTMPSSLHAK